MAHPARVGVVTPLLGLTPQAIFYQARVGNILFHLTPAGHPSPVASSQGARDIEEFARNFLLAETFGTTTRSDHHQDVPTCGAAVTTRGPATAHHMPHEKGRPVWQP